MDSSLCNTVDLCEFPLLPMIINGCHEITEALYCVTSGVVGNFMQLHDDV
jgi:hypothetical protein